MQTLTLTHNPAGVTIKTHVLMLPPAQVFAHTDGERDGVGVWLSFFCADPPPCTSTSSSTHSADACIATTSSHPHGSSTPSRA